MRSYTNISQFYGPDKERIVNAAVLVADFALLNFTLLAFFLFYGDWLPVFFHAATKVTVLVMNVSLVVSEYFFHSIIYRRIVKMHDIAFRAAQLVSLQVVCSFVLLRILSSSGNYFSFMLVFGVTSFAVLMLSRVLERFVIASLRQRGGNSRTVLLVGNDPAIKRVYRTIAAIPASGYLVLGYYADAPMPNAPEALECLGDLEALGRRMDEEADEAGTELPVNDIFLCLPPTQSEIIRRVLAGCHRRLIHFYYVPQQFEDFGVQLRPMQFADHVLYANCASPLLRLGNRVVKRVFDILFSLVVCLFLIPVVIIVGIIIKRQSPGPVFFLQKRTGMDGRDFFCYKFRSMHVNSDSDSVQATEHDPRKFPFGDFMRRTNIDELPQFFNVLKGDMSIVGPRPHMLMHTNVYGKLIKNYMARLFCKPGITGWAQVTGFRGETKETWQMEGRVNADIWYMEHWSFWLDMRIIWKTVWQTIRRDAKAY